MVYNSSFCCSEYARIVVNIQYEKERSGSKAIYMGK